MRLLSAAGAGCARVPRSVRALEEFPLLRRFARAVRTWKAGHFSFALARIFQPWSGVWVLPVSTAFWIFREILRAGHLVRQRIRIFHIFCVAVNSNPEAFRIHSRRMESVHSRCFWFVAALSAVRTSTLDIISRALQMADCGNFHCVVQHFWGPSMMNKSSSSTAHANSFPSDVAMDTVV